jgi:hypothetical protein
VIGYFEMTEVHSDSLILPTPRGLDGISLPQILTGIGVISFWDCSGAMLVLLRDCYIKS